MNRNSSKLLYYGIASLFFNLFVLVFGSSQSSATTIRAVTFEEMVQYAELVFEGWVVAVESELLPDSHIPRTCVQFEISEVFNGSHSDDMVNLCFIGGITGSYTVQVSNLQYPEPDEKGIYFVKSLARQYANPFYGWKQGHFIIETDPDTSREHVMTADRLPVTGITLEKAAPQRLSTGMAAGVKVTDRLQMRNAWTVEDFKKHLRSMLESMKWSAFH